MRKIVFTVNQLPHPAPPISRSQKRRRIVAISNSPHAYLINVLSSNNNNKQEKQKSRKKAPPSPPFRQYIFKYFEYLYL